MSDEDWGRVSVAAGNVFVGVAVGISLSATVMACVLSQEPSLGRPASGAIASLDAPGAGERVAYGERR